MDAAGTEGPPMRAGYRRSSGLTRVEARRQDLLARVTDHLAVHGLADFSLKRPGPASIASLRFRGEIARLCSNPGIGSGVAR